MKTIRSLMLLLALALFGFVLLAVSPLAARAADSVIVRVTVGGATTWPCGDQSNWSNPCALQTALTNTVAPSELWVAAGTYTPTMGVTRTATFQLRDGVALYGGFAGGETVRSERNITANVTILSGDIGAPGNASDNAYHVVTGNGVTNTAVLDGFTVTGGKADGLSYPDYVGGGMYNEGGSPALVNVTFSANSASDSGGAVFNHLGSPALVDVTLSDNWAYNGGAMYSVSGSPAVMNTTFISNSARFTGGGLSDGNSNLTLTNSSFTGNSATWGGGMSISYSSPTLTNITFSGNSASEKGGAMALEHSVSLTLTNVTFRGNSAFTSGGGMYNRYSSPTVRNAIFWGNTATDGAQIYNIWTSTPILSDSIVQGGCPDSSTTCANIITADPRLGPLGYWGGSTLTIPLLPGSSAIDTGNDAACPSTDQRGVPRPQGAHCDIGAFEGGLSLLNLPLIGR